MPEIKTKYIYIYYNLYTYAGKVLNLSLYDWNFFSDWKQRQKRVTITFQYNTQMCENHHETYIYFPFYNVQLHFKW